MVTADKILLKHEDTLGYLTESARWIGLEITLGTPILVRRSGAVRMTLETPILADGWVLESIQALVR